MGELRNSILELQKQVASASKTGNTLGDELEAVDQRVWKQFERQAGGVDVLWTYVDALFDKNGRNIKEHMNDKLSEHADSEIVSYLKGISSAADDCLKAIGEFDAIKAKMPAEYAKIDALAVNIRRNIEKKRAKLLQSKKYKAKIAGYDKALNELVQAVADRRKAFEKIATRDRETVERYRIKPTLKLSEVQSIAGIGITGALKDMKAQVDQNKWVSRKFHENGDLKAAFEQMKQWAGEADAMDQEVVNLDPNAAKALKNVQIQHNGKLVGTAPKAVYQGKRPMQVTVKWEPKVKITDLVQAKVTLHALFENGGGNFVNDMKVQKISDKAVTLISG